MIYHTPSNGSGPRICIVCKSPCHTQGHEACDTRYKWPWMVCHKIHTSSQDMERGLTFLWCNLQTGIASFQATYHQNERCGPRFCRICKAPSHSQESMGCDVRYKWSCMGFHSFHISCGYTRKVIQAWDTTHTCGCPQARP